MHDNCPTPQDKKAFAYKFHRYNGVTMHICFGKIFFCRMFWNYFLTDVLWVSDVFSIHAQPVVLPTANWTCFMPRSAGETVCQDQWKSERTALAAPADLIVSKALHVTENSYALHVTIPSNFSSMEKPKTKPLIFGIGTKSYAFLVCLSFTNSKMKTKYALTASHGKSVRQEDSWGRPNWRGCRGWARTGADLQLQNEDWEVAKAAAGLRGTSQAKESSAG